MDYTEITETVIVLLLETFIGLILLETAIVDEKFFIAFGSVINLDEHWFYLLRSLVITHLFFTFDYTTFY